jgi:hypothetical protein
MSDPLEDALNNRLHQFYMHSMHVVSRAGFLDKARSVTAGWAYIHAHGEDKFIATVNAIYDTEIPHHSKPVEDAPPKKRPLPLSAEDEVDAIINPSKRARIDPSTITDVEFGTEGVKCCGPVDWFAQDCTKVITSRDAAYTRGGEHSSGWDVVCLPCFNRHWKTTHCEHCGVDAATSGGPIDVWRGDYAQLHASCKTCRRLRTPPRVVHLKRTKAHGIVQNCDVYIGRACRQGGWALAESVWHNPFTVAPKATAEERDAVLAKYETRVRARPTLMARLDELMGKTLGCWCHPKRCHGDVLVALCEERISARKADELK